METIRIADQCMGADIIAWVSYPAFKKYCFVYPQYLLDSGRWKAIDSYAFPNNGSFFGAITGNSLSSEMQDAYGSVVVARVNAPRFSENDRYDSQVENSTFYSLAINPTFPKGVSELEFESFSDHSMSAELVQIVDVRESISFLKPFDKPVVLDGETDNLVSKLILVRNASGTSFGPFGYAKKDGNSVTLSAPSANDYWVARFRLLSSDDILTVRDEGGVTRCEFIEKRIIDGMFAEAEREGETLDWMPQSEFVNMVTRVINASEEFGSLSKVQLRSIKTAIRNYSDNVDGLKFDESRKQRIIDWLAQIDNLTNLPAQVVCEAIDSIPDERIAALVQDRRYFSQFKDRIIDNSGIREDIDEERRRLEESLSETRRQLETAKEEQAEAQREADEAKDRAAEAREQFEKVRDEALDQKREELDGLEVGIKERNAELSQLEEEYERLIVSKNRIERDVERIISGINDEVTASTKILESEILRKVVDAVYGVDLREDDREPVTGYTALFENEDSMSDDEIVELIYDSITRRAGRQITKNDAINLMVCLTQGYITTFAGQPGTGKTSLCGILASVLGLANDGAGRRFTEINVESGWTSYKDYVGYYNPLSKTYEKANTSVYDAMRMLSKEPSELSGIPPYVFLLDEANLSPIEHYWSPFLRACDTFQKDGATFSLGGTEKWHIPNRVRFLATVNFDHTTEALSHRFLDRSWVITLDPDFVDPDYDQVDIAKEFASERAFSSDRLFQVFGYAESDSLNQDNAQLLDELIRVCRMHSFPISPRSQLMMRRYIASASRLMSLQSKGSQYAPLDYAFSQKVLPQISGPAETVGELVEDLCDKCSQLKITKKQLEHMKGFGKDSGFYQYFI